MRPPLESLHVDAFLPRESAMSRLLPIAAAGGMPVRGLWAGVHGSSARIRRSH
jgi:hypothetical protein